MPSVDLREMRFVFLARSDNLGAAADALLLLIIDPAAWDWSTELVRNLRISREQRFSLY